VVTGGVLDKREKRRRGAEVLRNHAARQNLRLPMKQSIPEEKRLQDKDTDR